MKLVVSRGRIRRMEAAVNQDERQLAAKVARFFDSTAGLTNRVPTEQQRRKLTEISDQQSRWLRSRLERLQYRLRAAFATTSLASVGKLIKCERTRPFVRTAYFRDAILQSFFEIFELVARRHDDPCELSRIAGLREAWKSVDKRELRSESEIEALNFARKSYVFKQVSPALNETEWKKTAMELFAPVLYSIIQTRDGAFETAIAKAKERQASGSEGITEEPGLRADLMYYGILCRLGVVSEVGDTDALMDFIPRGQAIEKRNFQKLLNECLVPWTRKKRGRPRNKGKAASKK